MSDWYSAEGRALRDKLLELRREHTNGWDVYSPPGEQDMGCAGVQGHLGAKLRDWVVRPVRKGEHATLGQVSPQMTQRTGT